MKDLAILIGVPVALAAALIYPGWRIWGDDAFRHCGVALTLALLPAVATFVAIQRLTSSPESRLMSTLGSSGIRVGATLGIGYALYVGLPELFPAVFLYWLLVFYLVVLGLEVWLLTRRESAANETV